MDPGVIPPDYYLENYDVEKMRIQNYRICKKCNAVIDIDKGVEHFRLFIFSIFFHIGYLTVASMIMAITSGNKKK